MRITDTLRKYLDDKAGKNFNMKKWEDLYESAVSKRSTWQTDINVNLSYKENKITDSNLSNDEKSNLYVDNLILKSCILKKGMLSASEIDCEVKGENLTKSKIDDHLNVVTNHLLDKLNIVKKLNPVIDDYVWKGQGCVKTGWDILDWSQTWETGKPTFEYIPIEDVYPDPFTKDINFNDKRFTFCKRNVDKEMLIELFPEKKEIIEANTKEESEKVEMIYLEFEKTFVIEYIAIDDLDNPNTPAYFGIKDEILEYVKEKKLPELLQISEPIMKKEKFVFEASWIKGTDVIIDKVRCTGRKSNYHFFTSGLKKTDDSNFYPIISFTRDMQRLDILLNTIATYQALKNARKTPIIVEGVLKNQEDFIEKLGKPDNYGLTSIEAMSRLGEIKPVFYLEESSDNVNFVSFLSERIQKAQKEMNGATDTQMGQQTFSGQSGAAQAFLHQASSTYAKSEVLGYRYFLENIAESCMHNYVEYRDFEHEIPGIDEEGNETSVVVNDIPENYLDSEDYYCVVTIEQDPEIIKQAKKELAVMLSSKEAITNVDLLKMLDIPNAERLNENKLREQGILEIVAMLQQDPELMQEIRNLAMQRAKNSQIQATA